MKEPKMRRFKLVRQADVSGVSGVGIVAEGCEMTNGRIFLQWLTPIQSTTLYDNIKAMIHVHGHEGATKVEWIDQ